MKRRWAKWRDEVRIEHQKTEAAREENAATLRLLADLSWQLSAQTDRLKEAIESMGQRFDD